MLPLTDAALILQGGSFRCMFSAGALDVLMEHGLWFSYVNGVSAGALAGCNYLSRQNGRTRRVNETFCTDPDFLSLRNRFRAGGVFNFPFLFRDVGERIPMDWEALMTSPQRFEAVATDCLTGLPAYFSKDEVPREDFELARRVYRRVERVFLADGDALMRRTGDLVEIVGLVYGLFPECQRVTCYASPTSLQIKSEDELRLLRSKGLQMVYMGLESGCDAVLEKMQKGHTAAEIVAAGQKARRCGLALSVTAISGLGSVAHWREHAADTARAVSEMKPDYLGLLTLMVEPGTPLEAWVREGSFTLLSPLEVLKETELFLQHVDSEGTVFRANHASNYLTLKGTLNGDRKALLAQIAAALDGRRDLKPEFLRAL